MAPERTRQFRMNLSDSELAMLKRLADSKGLTASDYLRMLIREEDGRFITVRHIVEEEPDDRVAHIRRLPAKASVTKGPKPKRK